MLITDDPAALQAAADNLWSLKSLGALTALTALEIVLGIDNVVFISILASRLPKEQQKLARRLGLVLALLGRIILLLLAGWVMGLTKPWFEALGHEISGKDLFLLLGGAFLIYKATHEIHHQIKGHQKETVASKAAATLGVVIAQILLMDVIFSIDSVITAVGMTSHLPVMVTAVMVSIVVMIVFAELIASFIEKNPAFKMLGLAFLVLIGVMLAAEGLGEHIDRAYVYVAMAFALVVEVLQMLSEKNGAHAAREDLPAP